MVKERLSKLQKIILETIYYDGNRYFKDIQECVADKLNIKYVKGWNRQNKPFVRYSNDSFQASFSRSLRNLDNKDLICCYTTKGYINRVKFVKTTGKGKSLMFKVQNKK